MDRRVRSRPGTWSHPAHHFDLGIGRRHDEPMIDGDLGDVQIDGAGGQSQQPRRVVAIDVEIGALRQSQRARARREGKRGASVRAASRRGYRRSAGPFTEGPPARPFQMLAPPPRGYPTIGGAPGSRRPRRAGPRVFDRLRRRRRPHLRRRRRRPPSPAPGGGAFSPGARARSPRWPRCCRVRAGRRRRDRWRVLRQHLSGKPRVPRRALASPPNDSSRLASSGSAFAMRSLHFCAGPGRDGSASPSCSRR